MAGPGHTLELCAPPPIEAALPPTVERLQELLRASPGNADIHLTLGNLYFRRGQITDAVKQYEASARANPDNAFGHCNLGVSSFAMGNYAAAAAGFRKALLIDRSLSLAELYLGRIHLLQNNFEKAETSFTAVLGQGVATSEVYYSLGLVLEQRGEQEQALEKFQTAFQTNSNYSPARNRLCSIEFEKGRELMQQGELEDAFRIWWQADQKYSPAFTVDQRLAGQLRQIIEDYNESGALKTRIDWYSQQIHEGKEPGTLAYELISEFLFSLGLIPECFETRDTLEERRCYWLENLEQRGEHPYPHYRMALILAYQGKYEESIDELRICFDKLPVKKHAALKLRAVLRFVTTIRDIKPHQSRLTKSSAGVGAWMDEGFLSEFEIEAWKKTGAEPTEASRWRKAGFSARQTIQWREHDFELSEAQIWKEALFSDPGEAIRWVRGGFDAADARAWREQFSRQIEEVLQWHRAGFDSPEEASRWVELFTFPWEAVQWRDLGVSVEEAERWINGGFTDPYVVKRLQRRPQPEAGSEEGDSDCPEEGRTEDEETES